MLRSLDMLVLLFTVLLSSQGLACDRHGIGMVYGDDSFHQSYFRGPAHDTINETRSFFKEPPKKQKKKEEKSKKVKKKPRKPISFFSSTQVSS
ncbi:MAG: hypothetical protein HRT44_11670 [Bdellovibrionales bacterium]|nr:hypothetical protein [Bdellovibrionales bacterium]NQZ19899.1 hypothetical protein [Bdellovibrionales bacterium]